MPLIYIAGPFTASSRWEMACNIRAAEATGREVALLGMFPVIPHQIGENFDDEQTAEFWYEGTLELMSRCDAVLTTSNWELSKGASNEVKVADELGIPVVHSHTVLQELFFGFEGSA